MAKPRKPSTSGSRTTRRHTVPHYRVVWLSEQDSQVVGSELRRMAVARNINNLHHIDPEDGYDEVEKNKSHPLRPYFDWNNRSAARKHRIEYMGRLISSVQVVNIQLAPVKKYEPVFVTAKAEVVQQGSRETRSTHLMRPEMFTHDPAFSSYVNTHVSRMLQELNKLESVAASRPVPSNVQQFLADVRTAANAAGL